MFVRNGAVVTSASDLKAATECEWGLMRRLDAKLERIEAVLEPDDPMNRRAGALGDEHERRQLDAYIAEFGMHVPGTSGGVAVIAPPDPRTDFDALRAAQTATLDAMHDGADVVFQATFFDGSFVGFADFLLRTESAWAVYDTKLARRAKITALLQLAAYAKQLEALGIDVDPTVHLLLGDGTTSSHRLADITPVYERRVARLGALIEQRLAADSAIGWGDPTAAACGNCAECAAQIDATRDVKLVGRLTMPQRAKLAAAGIRTIDELAATTEPVAGIPAATLAKLRAQAQMQLEAPGDLPDGRHRVAYRVVDAEGLAAIPEPDPGDIFFDFEGDPLWTDDGRTWGLEYLFGLVVHEHGDRTHFVPFWAHDRAQEREALIGFLTSVRDRRAAHPGMHVYHYADYERSHLQQLCARHGFGEAILDDLLRDNVFVDLYPIVLRSIRISERSYSLKKLEPIYMGANYRNSEVTNAAASVDAYVEYTDLVSRGLADEAAAQLTEIADYNEYDCVSTLELRDWLLREADALGVARRGAPASDGPEAVELERREDVARDALLAAVADVPVLDRTADQTALALAAAAIEYHRREAKTYWWEHYNREIAPVDEWAEQRDVFVVDSCVVEQAWARHGRKKSDDRELRLIGQLAPGSRLRITDEPFAMYDEPVPDGCAPVPDGQRGEHDGTHVRAVTSLADGRTEIVLEEKAGLQDGVANAPWDALPIALTPAVPPTTKTQRGAILEWGEAVAASLPTPPTDPAFDLLRRHPPRIDGGLRPVEHNDFAAAIRESLRAANGTYLAVQGPPGSGKTYVGAQVIARLVLDHGWKIGVVAQSHAVVENLLDRVIRAGVPVDRVGNKPAQGGGAGGDWVTFDRNPDAAVFAAQHASAGFVIGGSSWLFSNAIAVPRASLDLLVIDEAGQFSLANAIAVSVSARTLLLLGDPQQLPQVTQGIHPEPVDTSALGWLSQGHDVLPASLGYFLAETWRMHPALTSAVSDLAYEGRLGSHQATTAARSLDGIEPGLHAVPVVHEGDSTTSEAEAARVVELVRSHVGRQWVDPSDGRADALRADDVIVVAPYNAQVAVLRAALDAAGCTGTPVGTVDKFQGQEAAIAVVSLTASAAADVPRGIDFLLNRNRLNVAISRAKWAAYLVHSPALADYLPTKPEGLAELSAFLRLIRGE